MISLVDVAKELEYIYAEYKHTGRTSNIRLRGVLSFVDLKRLPGYDRLKKYFTVQGMILTPVADGLALKGFAPEPPSRKRNRK